MRIARLNCERAVRGFDVSMLKTEQFHQWVSDFNSRSVAFNSHVRDTGKRLPGLSVGPPCGMSAAGCLLMYAVSRRRYARHTCSLQDETRFEIQASFCSHDLSMRAEPSACFTRRVRLLLIIITLGIGGDTQTDISYSPIRQCSEWILIDIRYRSNSTFGRLSVPVGLYIIYYLS